MSECPSASSPLDLTKVRLQASGDKRMVESMKKTVRTAGEYDRSLGSACSLTKSRSLHFILLGLFIRVPCLYQSAYQHVAIVCHCLS